MTGLAAHRTIEPAASEHSDLVGALRRLLRPSCGCGVIFRGRAERLRPRLPALHRALRGTSTSAILSLTTWCANVAQKSLRFSSNRMQYGTAIHQRHEPCNMPSGHMETPHRYLRVEARSAARCMRCGSRLCCRSSRLVPLDTATVMTPTGAFCDDRPRGSPNDRDGCQRA